MLEPRRAAIEGGGELPKIVYRVYKRSLCIFMEFEKISYFALMASISSSDLISIAVNGPFTITFGISFQFDPPCPPYGPSWKMLYWLTFPFED